MVRLMSIAHAVELEGIHKRFGGVQALTDVSLGIGQSVTGLLGPNGAGKTTLMRMVATVLAPDRGVLRLLGGDPTRSVERAEIRRRLGYMPQEPGFYRSFTTFEFVDYVAILKEMADRRHRHDEVRRVLGLVGLESVASRKVKALSGGMRRRLALAQALLGDPDLLVLDEPTAGLDPEQRLRFREVVSQLPNRPTVLISTHQTDDVSALCDQVVVLADGTVRFQGPATDLADTAAGRVWIDDARNDSAVLVWRSGDGNFRHIGDPPAGAQLASPTIDDAYLLLVNDLSVIEVTT
jgi:ABC-2 type transport system ATP-binding protein